MIDTFQGFAVALLALLPGAAYTFSFERVVGSFGVTFADRFVRFLAASAVFLAVFSAPELEVYRHVVRTGSLRRGSINSWWFEAAALAWVLIPTAVGSGVGVAYKKGWRWAVLLIGEAPEPRAWDYLWRSGAQGVVRLKLKSGVWLAGMHSTPEAGRRSFAAGYPEAGDLFLSTQLQVDRNTGEFARETDGTPAIVAGGSGLLVRWDEVEYLDFLEVTDD